VRRSTRVHPECIITGLTDDVPISRTSSLFVVWNGARCGATGRWFFSRAEDESDRCREQVNGERDFIGGVQGASVYYLARQHQKTTDS
jgi:hypothetical protein